MLVYATTTFIDAFLMFALEPMVAKMLLPTLGGTPMVWNTCVVFFQGALLGGYAFAHLLRLLTTRRAVVVLLALAAVAGVTLPIAFPHPPQDIAHATTWLLGQLVVSLGPVFFVLAAVGPSLQTWFSRSGAAGADNPYVSMPRATREASSRCSRIQCLSSRRSRWRARERCGPQPMRCSSFRSGYRPGWPPKPRPAAPRMPPTRQV